MLLIDGGCMAVQASDLLRDLEISVLGGDTDVWHLKCPDGAVIERRVTTPRDRLGLREAAPHLQKSTGIRALVVAGTVTAGLMDRALDGDIDLLLADPLQIIIAGSPYPERSDLLIGSSASRPVAPRSGSWNRWATTRMLAVADHGLSQPEIASVLGTSQQNISRILRGAEGIGRDVQGRYRADSPADVLIDWVREYPGPGGAAFGWYSLDHVVAQTERVYDIADLSGAQPLISGDVAADELSPWRLPGRGLIYLQSPLDLEDDGFVPASSDEATLVTVVPRDHTLWAIAAWQHGNVPRHADSAIIYRDLLHASGSDAPDAARAFLESVTRDP